MNGQVGLKIINLAHRQDRKAECRQEMAALGCMGTTLKRRRPITALKA